MVVDLGGRRDRSVPRKAVPDGVCRCQHTPWEHWDGWKNCKRCPCLKYLAQALE